MQNTVRWRCDTLDDTVVLHCLGTPGQTKVNGDRQRETTHENCYLAAEYRKLVELHLFIFGKFFCYHAICA